MGLIDIILNVAALLLWVSWRLRGSEGSKSSAGISLAATLRRAAPRPDRVWLYPLGLVVLLVGRAFVYWQMGSALGWMPHLHLGPISVVFRSDYLFRALLYSFLSFLWLLNGFYVWMVFLLLVHRDRPLAEAFDRTARRCMGRASSLPAVGLAVAPFIVVTIAWLLLDPVLWRLGMVPRPSGTAASLAQAAILGSSVYLCWKYLLVAVLLFHLVNTHVYMGNLDLWNLIHATARKVLVPLRWLPLRIGRVDLAPVAGILLVVLASEAFSRGLATLFRSLWI